MRAWPTPWRQGTYGQRVSAVSELDNQQVLYEICFCDPIAEVCLAAVDRLNQMQQFERPVCYDYTGAYFGSDDEPPYKEWFDSDNYQIDDPKQRKSIIPYVTQELFLFQIAWGDPDKTVAKLAAERIQNVDLLQNLNSRNYDSEVGAFAQQLIKIRKSGIAALKPIPIPCLGAKAGDMPPKTPLLRWELLEHAEMVKKYADPHGLMHFRIKESDIEIAIVAMQTFSDAKLAEALVRLYRNPNYALRDKIKQYDGTMIHGEISQEIYGFDYGDKKPPAFLRLDEV